MRKTHRARRETERQVSEAETHKDVRPVHAEAVEAPSLVPPGWFESVPPPTEDDLAEMRAEAAWESARGPGATGPGAPEAGLAGQPGSR